ncbi:tetratricopeptide repeat protein [Nannocystis pusilla]|uniref:tetratricopeptide repeat protein n=1 Tax=Nannocystis pusilla TaxID=889268 RepID=UPI003B7C6FA9
MSERIVTTPAIWKVVVSAGEDEVTDDPPERGGSPIVTAGQPVQPVPSVRTRRVQPGSSEPYVPPVDRAHVQFIGLLRDGCQKIDKDPVGALKVLRDAEQVYTGGRHFDLYMCLGRAHAAAGDHDSALVWYREAMLMSPTNHEVMQRFVGESILAGKRAGALSFLRGQRYKNPKNKVLSDYLDELNRQADDSVLLPIKGKVDAVGKAPSQP